MSSAATQTKTEPSGCLAQTDYGFVGPRAGTRPLNTWTLEAVVLFLPSRHFGRTWQTVRTKPPGGARGSRAAFPSGLCVAGDWPKWRQLHEGWLFSARQPGLALPEALPQQPLSAPSLDRCRKLAGADFGRLPLRRLLSAPDHASGRPVLRAALDYQPLGRTGRLYWD